MCWVLFRQLSTWSRPAQAWIYRRAGTDGPCCCHLNTARVIGSSRGDHCLSFLLLLLFTFYFLLFTFYFLLFTFYFHFLLFTFTFSSTAPLHRILLCLSMQSAANLYGKVHSVRCVQICPQCAMHF